MATGQWDNGLPRMVTVVANHVNVAVDGARCRGKLRLGAFKLSASADVALPSAETADCPVDICGGADGWLTGWLLSPPRLARGAVPVEAACCRVPGWELCDFGLPGRGILVAV